MQLASAFHFDLVNLLGRALGRLVLDGGWVTPAPLDCLSSTRDPATYNQSRDLIATMKQVGPHGGALGASWVVSGVGVVAE